MRTFSHTDDLLPIDHIVENEGDMVAICGKRLSGRNAAPAHDLCVVCADLWIAAGRTLGELRYFTP